jgi:hypothetical protein
VGGIRHLIPGKGNYEAEWANETPPTHNNRSLGAGGVCYDAVSGENTQVWASEYLNT